MWKRNTWHERADEIDHKSVAFCDVFSDCKDKTTKFVERFT